MCVLVLVYMCVMSPWLFNIYMDGVMKEVKGKVGLG